MKTRRPWDRVRLFAAPAVAALMAGGCALKPPPPAVSAPPPVSAPKAAAPPARAVPPPQEGLQLEYRQAVSDLEQGRFDPARAALEGLVRQDSSRLEIHNALGVLYRRQGLADRAIGEYQKALAIALRAEGPAGGGTDLPELYNNLAIAYREAGRFEKAEEAYRTALARRPDWETAHYNLGVLYDLYLNRPAEALSHYRDYLRLHGKDETVGIWVADLEQRLGAGGDHAQGP